MDFGGLPTSEAHHQQSRVADRTTRRTVTVCETIVASGYGFDDPSRASEANGALVERSGQQLQAAAAKKISAFRFAGNEGSGIGFTRLDAADCFAGLPYPLPLGNRPARS